eukprot:GHVN01032167.1.p1 GENE.GHVN01032167.1~~GHVN01032167.1.p1  ORF type:complete len:388 (+),score=62.85 GHVN01032167.1:495-1658(+)
MCVRVGRRLTRPKIQSDALRVIDCDFKVPTPSDLNIVLPHLYFSSTSSSIRPQPSILLYRPADPRLTDRDSCTAATGTGSKPYFHELLQYSPDSNAWSVVRVVRPPASPPVHVLGELKGVRGPRGGKGQLSTLVALQFANKLLWKSNAQSWDTHVIWLNKDLNELHGQPCDGSPPRASWMQVNIGSSGSEAALSPRDKARQGDVECPRNSATVVFDDKVFIVGQLTNEGAIDMTQLVVTTMEWRKSDSATSGDPEFELFGTTSVCESSGTPPSDEFLSILIPTYGFSCDTTTDGFMYLYGSGTYPPHHSKNGAKFHCLFSLDLKSLVWRSVEIPDKIAPANDGLCWGSIAVEKHKTPVSSNGNDHRLAIWGGSDSLKLVTVSRLAKC